MSKSKRLITGSILGGASFILRTLISLFMTPFMIACLGDHSYGLWMLVASLSGFYGILDLGLSTAVQRYMARSIGAGDQTETNSVFNTSLAVFCGLGCLAALFAGALAWAAPVFVKTVQDIPVFRIIIVLCSVNIIISFPMRSFWGILSSNLRYDISTYLETANVILKAVLIIAFLQYGFGVIALAAINLVIDLIWNVSNIFYALKIAPYIAISKKYLDFKKLKTFLGYSVYVLISRIADTIKFNIDGYVISAFIGLGSVTIYSIGIRLIDYATQFLGKLIGLMTPVFSQYEGEGNFEAIREKFLFMLKIATFGAVFLGGLLIVLARPFITRWVGPGYDESARIVWIFAIPTVFRMIMIPSDQLLYGISRHKFLTVINTAEAITNLVLSLIFVRWWGIQGVALGTAIPMVIAKLMIQPVYTARVLNVRMLSLYKNVLTCVIKGAVVLSILYLLVHPFMVASFIKLTIFVAIQAICYSGILFRIGFSGTERKQIKNALRIKNFCSE